MSNAPNQLARPQGVFTTPMKHPGRRDNPYDEHWCALIVTRYRHGIPLDSDHLQMPWDRYGFPFYKSCMRYIEKYRQYGHWQPKHANENHVTERKVLGQPLIRVVLYRVVHLEVPLFSRPCLPVQHGPYCPSI